jgi:hypothetical protein
MADGFSKIGDLGGAQKGGLIQCPKAIVEIWKLTKM